MVKYCDGNVRNFSMSDTQSKTTFEIFYQNVGGFRTKQTELFDNVCSMDFKIICLTETWLNDVFPLQTLSRSYKLKSKVKIAVWSLDAQNHGIVYAGDYKL
jgi:hypothetical protein